MENVRRAAGNGRDRQSEDGADDPVLGALDQIEASYRDLCARWQHQATEATQARRELAGTREEGRRLADELAGERARSERERAQAERQRSRADGLAATLKEIHRSLFHGNVYDLILKACLTLTGATRGLYITARSGDALRVRAAQDVDGYPSASPSEFLRALCDKVRSDQESFVCNSEADRGDLPQPTDQGEAFRNLVVAPVVLLKDFDGIVVVADKPNGEFDDDDVETLLGVGDQAAVAAENDDLRRQLEGAYLSTIMALADAVEAKDPYTHGHCGRVARYAHRIAERMGLPEREQSLVYYAALLHDVGKIGVSDGVLNKSGTLLTEERALVRSHVRVGHDLIHKIPALEPVAESVLRRHEWYDGTGYPDGLAGEEIPLASRIVGVADAYGAMLDRRSYKEPYGTEHACAELLRCAGIQFDPEVVKAFVELLDSPGALDAEDDDAEWSVPLAFGRFHRPTS